MKRLIYILIVVSLVVMASGCTGDKWSSTKTYSGNGLTFTYPGTWSENASSPMNLSGASTIEAVGTSDEAFAVGTVSVGVSDDILQQAITQTAQTYVSQGYTQKSITVDGVTATMITNPNLNAEGMYLSLVFWPKNSKLYYAAYGTKNNDTQTMEKLLGSLKAT